MFGFKTESIFGRTKQLEQEIDQFVDIVSEVGLVFKKIVPTFLKEGASDKFNQMVQETYLRLIYRSYLFHHHNE